MDWKAELSRYSRYRGLFLPPCEGIEKYLIRSSTPPYLS